jgi:ParB family chromosome partitioning protein
VEVAALVVKTDLSVRETEAIVRRMTQGGSERTETAPAASGIDPDVQRLELDLSEKLGARVAIQHTRSGKGKVVVSYNSLDELDGILEHIR